MEQSWTGRDGQTDSLRISQRSPHMPFAEKRGGFEGGKKGSLSNYFQRLKTVSPSWRMYSVSKMIKTAPYDLELQILFLACFHPLSVENNDTAWISIFIKGFLFKVNILLEVFPLHFRRTDNFLSPSGMCKPGCKALLKCMRTTIFIYTIFMATQKH